MNARWPCDTRLSVPGGHSAGSPRRSPTTLTQSLAQRGIEQRRPTLRQQTHAVTQDLDFPDLRAIAPGTHPCLVLVSMRAWAIGTSNASARRVSCRANAVYRRAESDSAVESTPQSIRRPDAGSHQDGLFVAVSTYDELHVTAPVALSSNTLTTTS